MSVRPQPNGEPRVGCCTRLCTRLASRVSDAVAHRKARRAVGSRKRRGGLVVKGSSVTRADGERLGTAKLLDGQQVDVGAAQLARPNAREYLRGRRQVTLRQAGKFVGVIEIHLWSGKWIGRGGLDTYSVKNSGEQAPWCDEISRSVAFLLAHARF